KAADSVAHIVFLRRSSPKGRKQIRNFLFPDLAGCGSKGAGGERKHLACFGAVGVLYAKMMHKYQIESLMQICKYYLP
ncbi:hypothetical protein, partial [Enterobacter cloacae]|uniref:hypothetical protein n=1 Tax=Enterobacter cloacae TaxID=550 RepID=UPI001C8C0B70